MTKKILVSFSLAGAMLLTACDHRELPAMGDYSVQVFHDTLSLPDALPIWYFTTLR